MWRDADGPWNRLGRVAPAAETVTKEGPREMIVVLDYDREYHPCFNGLHVCGVTPDDERPATVANVPGVTMKKFTALAAEFGLAGDDFDLVVDFMRGGDIMQDFCIRRQQLDALLRAAK